MEFEEKKQVRTKNNKITNKISFFFNQKTEKHVGKFENQIRDKDKGQKVIYFLKSNKIKKISDYWSRITVNDCV